MSPMNGAKIGILPSHFPSLVIAISVLYCILTSASSHSSSKTNSIVRTYVLPDFVPTSANKLGYLRPLPTTGSTPPPSPPLFDDDAMRVARRSLPIRDEEEQLLQMSNERFTVPELLFNPSCIGSLSYILTWFWSSYSTLS